MKIEQPKINYMDLPSIKCDNCGGEIFIQVTMLKEISSIYTQTGKTEILSIPLYECNSCGHINESLYKHANGQ